MKDEWETQNGEMSNVQTRMTNDYVAIIFIVYSGLVIRHSFIATLPSKASLLRLGGSTTK